MARLDPRVLLLAPLLMFAGGCGDDPDPVSTPSPPVVASAPESAPPPSLDPSLEPESTESVYEEEEDDSEPEPSAVAGDLPGQAQSLLDEALGLELGALEGAPAEAAASRRKALDKLPDNPRLVLSALKNYVWYSPEARALYDKAVKAS